MGRTLYLNDTGLEISVKRDALSLWITRPKKSGQRVPVRLLSRVVIIGDIWIDSSAITMLTSLKIPVVFMNREAQEIAIAQNCDCRWYRFSKQQRAFVERLSNIRQFSLWAWHFRLGMERRVLKRLYKYLSEDIRCTLNEASYKEVLSYLKPKDERRWIVIHRFVRNINKVLVLEWLMKKGLDPHVGIIYRRMDYGLALDICWMIEAEIDLQTIQYFKSSIYSGGPQVMYKRPSLNGNDIKNIVHRFENRRKDIENTIRSVIEHMCLLFGVQEETKENKILDNQRGDEF